jgi:hypothetical protein
MMPDPMSMSSEDRIRRLQYQAAGSLPSMQAPPVEPMHDIEVGPMGDFSPQAQGGFEFDQHAGAMGQDIPTGMPRSPGGQTGNPRYDAMRAEKAMAYQQAQQAKRDDYIPNSMPRAPGSQTGNAIYDGTQFNTAVLYQQAQQAKRDAYRNSRNY